MFPGDFILLTWRHATIMQILMPCILTAKSITITFTCARICEWTVCKIYAPSLIVHLFSLGEPSLQWRDGVSNHQPLRCLLNRLFGRRSKQTSKLRLIGFCVGNSPGTGEFPAQMANNAENVSIWWHHHAEGDKNPKSVISKPMLQVKFVNTYCDNALGPRNSIHDKSMLFEVMAWHWQQTMV